MTEPTRLSCGLMKECPAPRFESDLFAPRISAAQSRITAVRPGAYARTRNALDGAVSNLSPYITHGFVTLADVQAVTEVPAW